MTDQSLVDLLEFGLTDEDLAPEYIVQSLIASAGGSVAGRIRMQKIVFLLDKMGLDSGFEYSYHHYGPYASDLSDAIDFAKAFGLISEEFEHRKSDGARYSIFRVKSELKQSPRSEFLREERIARAISLMSVANSTVLELSATAYWLRHDESFSDWKKELVKRKGQKTEAGRLEKAEQLLANLGLN